MISITTRQSWAMESQSYKLASPKASEDDKIFKYYYKES